MTDDLVKRLRITAGAGSLYPPYPQVINEAADRIEALKDDIHWMDDRYKSVTRRARAHAAEAANRIEELEKEVEQWKQRCLSTFVEMVTLLGDTATEKANIRTIFENVEEVFVEDRHD